MVNVSSTISVSSSSEEEIASATRCASCWIAFNFESFCIKIREIIDLCYEAYCKNHILLVSMITPDYQNSK
jgi:hypothetical protein